VRLERVDATDARAVLRGLRSAVLGAGPAIALGGEDDLPREVPAGTAVVVTTSGSSGYPKAVALSRSALTASAMATAARIGSGSWLLALAPGYIAGVQVLVRALVAGNEPAVVAGPFRTASFVAAASSMASSRGGERVPTFTSLVPAQLQTLLDEPAGCRALAGFAAVLVGGQALPPALAARANYDGIPLDGVGVRIVDGEVHVSGPTLADGYLGEPERTSAAFVRDDAGVRWYRTGDAGRFDGRLTVTGRRDNVIVSGGVNVSLDRVERIVRTLPGFVDAVVVPVADERWGEASIVVAVGASSSDAPVDADLPAVRDLVGDELGAPARPRAILRVPRLPTLPSGKPDRAALTALARTWAESSGDSR